MTNRQAAAHFASLPPEEPAQVALVNHSEEVAELASLGPLLSDANLRHWDEDERDVDAEALGKPTVICNFVLDEDDD